MIEFSLPSLGADMDEGKLVEWQIAPGDTVEKGQIVAVVETTKAAIDVESWVEGTVHELLIAPGDKVPVGTVIATLLAPGEEAPEAGAPVHEAPAQAAATPSPITVEPPVEAAPPAPAMAESPPRRRISPAAHKRAAELGLDLAQIPASGPGGTVTLADVERVATGPAPVSVSTIPPTAPTTTTSATTAAERQAEMRRAIAAAMSRSKREIPHYYLTETVPLRRATEWLTAFNAGRSITERIVMSALQLKAVALALPEVPEMNGHYVEGQFRPSASAHLGVAISLRQGGLVAPALHDVGAMTLPEVMAAMLDLVQRARTGSLRTSEVSDATITVTSLGDQGVESVLGIIHPPQVAIIGFGTVAPRPWVEDGELTVMPTVVASLAADHRVSDGHRGALFLAAVRDRLQHPDEL